MFKKGLELSTIVIIILALALLFFLIFFYTGLGTSAKELLSTMFSIF